MFMQSRVVDTLVLARAFGITLMVLNHSTAENWLPGGLNILLVLSGVSFASLGFAGSTKDTLRTMVWFLALLLLIAWAMTLLAFVKDAEIRPLELLMVSAWVTTDFLSDYPIWYVQVILQIFLFLGFIFAVFDLTPKVRANPVLATALFLVAGVAAGLVGKQVWNPPHLWGHLPYIHVWTFLLGWLYWALFVDRAPDRAGRALFGALALASGILMLGPEAMDGRPMRLCVYGAAVLFLALSPQLRLPASLVHVVYLVSQSTLYLFFLHWTFFKIATLGLMVFDTVPGTLESSVKFNIAMAGSILTWAFVTAVGRSWAKRKRT